MDQRNELDDWTFERDTDGNIIPSTMVLKAESAGTATLLRPEEVARDALALLRGMNKAH
ncbi:hypothetical protein [Denitrobaculum tricleocarpae]|uniref:hypothetical protein n=1 Tax=Denitrobaculum tricleocarpae TaxID=2591009 RepID=UPI0015D125BA|nr:hypothetical protein [Denitrobaculum tricleocarpae]